MSGFVYLVKIGDLYKIGTTTNLDRCFEKLKPEEIIQTLNTNEPRFLEARLLRRYRSVRIPETDYFKLDNKQVIDCKKELVLKADSYTTNNTEFYITLNASILLTLITLSSLLYFNIGILKSFCIALSTGSIPMWFLFFSGNFGGYEMYDLPLFYTWLNRLKSLFIALIMFSFAFVAYRLII